MLEMLVTPEKIAHINTGDRTKALFAHTKTSSNPVISGTVYEISPIPTKNQMTGEIYYKAKVKLNNTVHFETKWNMKLVEGMRANINIGLQCTSPINYLSDKIQYSFMNVWES